MLSGVLLLIAFTPAQVPAGDFSVAGHIARGDSLHDALEPVAALAAYRAALTLDSASVEARWKAARSYIDIAKQLPDDRAAERDSLFGLARQLAETVLAADSTHPEGHFMLAQALGRLSRTKGGKERVRYARDIYNEAARALELDPDHDGALHVLGAWHAEVRRLSGVARFFARTVLGGGFLSRAHWDSAVVHLERAVERRPNYLYHRLELAEIYADAGRPDDAIRELERLLALPATSDVMDPAYQRQATTLLGRLRARRR